MEKGFYKNESGTLLFAPNFVESKDLQLYKESKDSYIYPVNGWYWFDTLQEAETTLGVKAEWTEADMPNLIAEHSAVTELINMGIL